MKLRIFFLIGFFSFCYAQSEHIVLTPRLQMLLDDMRLYKLDSEGDEYLHAGDLYEHSLWAYYAMVELFENNSPYVGNLFLTERQKEVVSLAALLHDIGKAGRLALFEHTHLTLHYDIIKNDEGKVKQITYYQDRQTHPQVGFEYAGKHLDRCNHDCIGQDYYYISENSMVEPFDMVALYDELGLTQEEQKVIAILIGIHWDFGNVTNKKITVERFLQLLKNLVIAVDYNHGVLDECIVHLAMLISVADVKGIKPVKVQPSLLFPVEIICHASHEPIKIENPFKAFGYESDNQNTPTFAMIAMQNVFNCFYEQQAGK